MKEVFSGTLAVGALGWVVIEGLLSGNPFLLASGFLVSIVAFGYLGCICEDNAKVNAGGLVVAMLLTAFGLYFGVDAIIGGQAVAGTVKILFFLAFLVSSIFIYISEKEGHDDAHGHGEAH